MTPSVNAPEKKLFALVAYSAFLLALCKSVFESLHDYGCLDYEVEVTIEKRGRSRSAQE